MVSTVISLDNEYGLVILTAVSTLFLGTWHGTRVGAFRKLAKIPYPFEYASYEQIQTASPATKSAMMKFNSAQRAHQNYNENHPSALVAMLVAGLEYPRLTAVLGAAWAVQRVVYAVGYTRGTEDGKGRLYGIGWVFAHLGLLGVAGKVGWDVFAKGL